MLVYFKLILMSIFLMFQIGCDSSNKKVYKKFDTSSTHQSGAQTLSDSKKDGGYGFESIAEENGWLTNLTPNILGDPNAIKGDTLRFLAGMVFPNTLRAFGKETRSQLNSLIEGLIYEPLLTLDSETLRLQPALATHWKVEDDSLTFLFRIDPRARFSDGRKVITLFSRYNIFRCDKLLISGGNSPESWLFVSIKRSS